MKTSAIIQARILSKRLHEKVLKKLPYGGQLSVLEQVIKRLRKSRELDEIIVATTQGKEAEQIVKICNKWNIKYFRGCSEDVLSRFYFTACENNVDIVVRITADCPCIDPEIVDLMIKKHKKTKIDYTSNALIRSYPRGIDTEVFGFNALKKAYNKANKLYEREHVTPYIYKNPQIFKIANVKAPKKHYAPEIRITLDTEEDYVLLCAIFSYLYHKNEYFNIGDIIALFKENPWLKAINERVVQKKVIGTLEEEIEEAIELLDMQDLKKAKDFLKKHFKK